MAWFEFSDIQARRASVGECLEKEECLPPSKNKNESAAAFWQRVEKAGLLEKAIELYDQFAEQEAEWVHRPRETKKMFADRIAREGRQAEVEAARKELLEDGYSLREMHEKLVWKFQPLDKNWTRPWTTPDPWTKGRLFRKKEDQEKLLALANPDEDEDEESKAGWLVECAKWRREERVALANARRRASKLEEAAMEPKVKEVVVEEKNGEEPAAAQRKNMPEYKPEFIVVKDASGELVSQRVPR